MVKKLNAILLILIVIFTMPIVAFAEDDSNSDTSIENEDDEGSLVNTGDNDVIISYEETEEEEEESDDDEVIKIDENESKIISNAFGAEIRLLQLRRRIEIQIETANLIIENIESDNTSNIDTDELKEYVIQFENLILETETINEEDSSENLEETYLAIKDEAIKLTKDFRTTIGKSIGEEKKEQLKEKIQENKNSKTQNKDARIEQLKKQYNVQKVQKILKNFGNNDSKLVQKIETDEITLKEAKSKIVEEYNSMSSEKQAEVKSKFQEQRKTQREEAIKKQKELKQQIQEKRKEIKENFEKRREELKTKVQEKRQTLKENFQQRQENIKNNINARKSNSKNSQITNDNLTNEENNEENGN